GHRHFNRDGEGCDGGETVAGVEYEAALVAVEELRSLMPHETTMAQMALRWILMNDGISTVIPGAKTPEQASANAAASDLSELPASTMDRIAELYRERI